MVNLANEKIPVMVISDESYEIGLSIHEIKTIYKKVNTNMVEAMERIEDILFQESFNKNDILYLRNRNNFYKTLTLRDDDAFEHGESLMKSILTATLSEAYNRSLVFFDSRNNLAWFEKLDEYRIQFLQMDGETTFLLSVVNGLYDSLWILYKGFNNQPLSLYENDELDFDFDLIYNQVLSEPDLFSKMSILYNAIAEKDLLSLKSELNPYRYQLNENFKKCCNDAIDIIQTQIENTIEFKSLKTTELKPETRILTSDTNIKYPEFTTKRQVLAMYYLLNEADKNTNSIDRTVRARFILFMTGKNESNIYDALSNPFKGLENEKNKKAALEDMKFVRSQFELLQMNAIVEKITKDMKID
ncbi:MAG: hypothetical protein GZ091_17250 [Paludibacter sp.]|nr:hypothetical protein [Paludibacter sp.]